MFVLPTTIAPASRSLATTGESAAATGRGMPSQQPLVGTPATS